MADFIRLERIAEFDKASGEAASTRALLVNPGHIVSITIDDDYQTRIGLANGEQHMVTESFDDVERMINP